MIAGFTTRLATTADIATIARHRTAMFSEMGNHNQALVDAHEPYFVAWVRPKLESGEYKGFFACDGDKIAAGAGLWFMDWPPGPLNVSFGRPYVLNVYTEVAYRHKGLARGLVQTILDYCQEQGYSVVELHASEAGRPIYESLGFTSTNQMRVRL